MNIADLIQTFRREDIENGVYVHKKPLIVLSSNMYDATKEMCHTERENLGRMLYYKSEDQSILNQDLFIILHMINIGYGTSVSTYPDEKRSAASHKLLSMHPKLSFIDYHTHTVSTGDAYTQQFSSMDGGDISRLTTLIERYEGYMHVLFTPTHILTFGRNRPYFAITTKASPVIDQEMIKLDEEFREILATQ